MGIEYALAHEPSGEAFELGKNSVPDSWWLRLPCSRDELHEELIAKFAHVTEAVDFAWISLTADRVWDFIVTHSGCVIVSDCGDDHWSSTPAEVARMRAEGEVCYLVVGSRYASFYKDKKP